MNVHLLSSLLLCAVCAAVFINAAAAQASALDHVTAMSSSGEGLQSAVGGDLDSENDQDPSGMFKDPALLKVHQFNRGEESTHRRPGHKKNRGKKKNKNITPVQPDHSFSTHQSHSSTADPCRTSHLDYCIHGHCTYLHDLREPVCICKRGYDGERCGIQLLQTSGEPDDSSTETVHAALIIVAVVLSVISCLAVLLMICVHYRTHHRFQATFLSSSNEREQLQKKNMMV